MILVDPIVDWGEIARKKRLRYTQWCHMVSDTSAEELHEFAARLGLKRSWSQERPKASAHHYDLTPAKRIMAVRLGAVEVTARELVMRNYDGLRARGLLKTVEDVR